MIRSFLTFGSHSSSLCGQKDTKFVTRQSKCDKKEGRIWFLKKNGMEWTCVVRKKGNCGFRRGVLEI